MGNRFSLNWKLILEYIFAIAVIFLIGRAIWWLFDVGHLPQPFFYEPSDTFMDWFNTAYWSHNSGPYDTWGTIYPPISFLVMRFLSIPRCYADTQGLETRDCDWLGPVVIGAIFAINLVLIALTFFKVNRETAIPRTVALAFGMPMLFAVERGNILLLCFTCFLLGFGPLLRSARIRWIFVGLAVNFKVYLIAAIVAQALRRRWTWVEGALIATIVIYIFSLILLGFGTPGEVARNIMLYADGFSASQVLDIWYSVTYMPLISLLEGRTFPIVAFVGSKPVDLGLFWIPLLVRVGQISVILASVATWVRPEVVPNHRIILFGLAFALISSEAGGYTLILLILLVFLETWRGFLRPLSIVLCYVLSLPGDLLVGHIPPIQRFSYLTDQIVEVHIGVGLGMFLRPGLLIIIAVSLSLATILDVWKDIRLQGWSGRWRYRRDWPALPGILRPVRESTARPTN